MPAGTHMTMKDVARLAGVSVSTVSAFITGTVTVSSRTAGRVRKAMEALDYQPDDVARSLRTGQTHVFGVVIPDITNPFFPEVLRGIEDAASADGYSVVFCNSNEDPVQEERQLNGLLSRRVDGLLISCCDRSTGYERLLRRHTPIMFFDQLPHGLEVAGVTTDNIGAAYEATRLLIQLGHLRIAVMARQLNISPQAERVEGFRKAMQEAGLPIREEYFRAGPGGEEAGYRNTIELFGLPSPPTAIFCCNNRMLLGLARALGDAPAACPDQVSIIGFDDPAWTRAFQPRLTVVAQRAYEIGVLATKNLIESVASGAKASPGVIRLPAELRIRNSTSRIVSI